MPRRPLAALAPNPEINMKKLTLISAFCFLLAAFSARAWTITNVNIGVDLNSAAWAKVNNNNNNFVGWLNQVTDTNNLLVVQVTNLWSAFDLFTNSRGLATAGGNIYFWPASGGYTAGAHEIDFDGQYGQASFLGGQFYFINGSAFGASGVAFGSDGSASFANGAVTVESDGDTYLPNSTLYADGTVCFGQMFDDSENVTIDPQARILYDTYGGQALAWYNGGSVSFLNATAAITADSAGHGGTTLMLQAQDNGTPMYLHVTSAGVATWTTAP
jgi:hypothetical protein